MTIDELVRRLHKYQQAGLGALTIGYFDVHDRCYFTFENVRDVKVAYDNDFLLSMNEDEEVLKMKILMEWDEGLEL